MIRIDLDFELSPKTTTHSRPLRIHWGINQATGGANGSLPTSMGIIMILNGR